MKIASSVVVIFLFSSLGISGCHRGLVATTPIPPHQKGVEIYPSKKHIWVTGKHKYRNGSHSFRRGRYHPKSNDKPVLIAAHWEKTSAGYVWVPARWKKF